MKEKYPELSGLKIAVKKEQYVGYIMVDNQYKYSVVFIVSEYDYIKYALEGYDREMWNNIRELVRDVMKMLGIYDKVEFQFWSRND